MKMNKLIVSLSPHAHGTDSVERNMYGVTIAINLILNDIVGCRFVLVQIFA